MALAVLVCALLPPHAGAEKLYRCGNTFQDRPCNATPPAQPVNAAPSPAAAAPAAPSAGEQSATEKRVQQSASAREAQRRRDLCESLKLQLEDVQSRERAGGEGETKENLVRQRRDIEGKLSASRC